MEGEWWFHDLYYLECVLISVLLISLVSVIIKSIVLPAMPFFGFSKCKIRMLGSEHETEKQPAIAFSPSMQDWFFFPLSCHFSRTLKFLGVGTSKYCFYVSAKKNKGEACPLLRVVLYDTVD